MVWYLPEMQDEHHKELKCGEPFVAATIHEIWAERDKYTTQELCNKIVNDMQLYLQRRLVEAEDSIELRVLMSRLNIEVRFESKHATWIKWLNPAEDVIMLNTDGAVGEYNGFGGVFRDWQGNVEMAFTGSSQSKSVIGQELSH
ncbi:hypothetical protein IFM89_008055 [Coptis chinensis]|uniref:RNase H type-1 domain-containing protein n=1 Tax=Coptis chinensis TaxID=261450 RepID=A0A835IWV0_9MAGN|nr:hypothetical protein IFM89_008055 [Coptis chinensis]